MSLNSVNCLGNPEEGNQQPSITSNSFEGSTTRSESQEDNNSSTKAGQDCNIKTQYKFLLDEERKLFYNLKI